MLVLLGLKGIDMGSGCLDSCWGGEHRGVGTKVKFLLWSLTGIPEATTPLATTPGAYSSGKRLVWRTLTARGIRDGLLGPLGGDTGAAH